MDVNILITENNFAPATGISSVPSKSDQSNKAAKFSLPPDDKQPQVKSPEQSTADNVSDEIHNSKEPDNKSHQKITKSIDTKTKSENPAKAENKTEPEKQIANPAADKQPGNQKNLTQSRSAKNSVAGEHINSVKVEHSNLVAIEHTNLVATEHSKKGAATKIMPKVGRQLAQIITNTSPGKSSTVTKHAVKSAEIKLLHATEKGQLGLKTVLPAKSNGENGLKTGTPGEPVNIPLDKIRIGTANNIDMVSVSARTITETKSATEKKSTADSPPEVPVTTGKSTNVASVKQTAENINPKIIQAKTPEVQPQPAGINPQKPAPTNQTDAKVTTTQNISNLSNPNVKESTHTGNDIPENQSVQKLKIEAVQVSTDQTKEQSISTSNKNTSQGFEQMLSHNNSQMVITEQTSATAKNTTASKTPDQNSFKDVSADIGKQILESVQRSASQQGIDRQITVRLNPPELGKVLIKFQQHDSELTGLMEVSKNQTRVQIEQTLPQIIRNLADSGIHIKRLEVMLSNEEQSGHGASGNQSLQSGGTQQQNSSHSGTPQNNQNINQSNDWLTGNNSYENLSELQGEFITDSSINMLI